MMYNQRSSREHTNCEIVHTEIRALYTHIILSFIYSTYIIRVIRGRGMKGKDVGLSHVLVFTESLVVLISRPLNVILINEVLNNFLDGIDTRSKPSGNLGCGF